jgi:chromosomal replication initiator protein
MQRMDALPEEIWSQILSALEGQLSRPAYANWVKSLRPVSLDEQLLTLAVESEFARDWLEKRASKTIRTIAPDALGKPIQVQFVLTQMHLGLPDTGENPTPAPKRTTRATKSSITISNDEFASMPLNMKYTFDNFVIGKANQFAHAAALAVTKGPGKVYNPLFLYGGVGLGKTHLMQAIGSQLLAQNHNLQVTYISGDTFTYHVVNSIRENRFPAFRARYRAVDVWLVDDIQLIAAKERTEAEFFQTFNALYEMGKQIVISSDRPAKELRILDDRLKSRFEWGLMADLKAPDFETRIAILQRRAEAEGTGVPEDVIRYIAKVCDSNIRILEGALTKVIAASSLTGVEITLALAAEQLKDHSLGGRMKPMNISQIQQVVASHFHLTVEQLNEARRTRDLVFARQMAMFLARATLHSSFPEIAKEFGGKDHSTVIHACTKIKEMMERDQQVRALVTEIEGKLRGSLRGI